MTALARTGAQIEALAPIALGDDLVCTHIPAQPGQPTVLFLHGWVMNRSTWFDAASVLPAGYGMLFPDLPGHGASPPLRRVENTAVFEEMAAQVVRVLDALDLPAVHIAGYSMGATVALSLARHHTARVQSLYILDPIVRFPPLQMAYGTIRQHMRFHWNMISGFFRPRGLSLLRALIGLTVAGFWLPTGLKRLLLRPFARRADTTPLSYVNARKDIEVQLFLDGFLRTSWWTTAQTLESKHRVNYLDVFNQFAGPVHLATGVDDVFASERFLRSLSRRGAQGARQAAHPITVIADTDHLSVCTQSGLVGKDLRAFLDSAVSGKTLS